LPDNVLFEGHASTKTKLKGPSPVHTEPGPLEVTRFGVLGKTRSIVTAERAQQVQQTHEKVVERHVERDGSHDVIGLTAVDDCAGLVKDEARGEQNESRRDRQRQRGQIEEKRRQSGKESHQYAHEKEPSHEGEILAAHERVGGKREKDERGRAQRLHDQLGTIWRGEVKRQNRPQGDPHEAGKREHAHNAHTAITELGSEKQQPEVPDQRDPWADERKMEEYRHPSRRGRESQRQREQGVSVTDEPVCCQRLGLRMT